MTPFLCPVCRQALFASGESLVCDSRHTFDVARQGYVNLLRKKPDTLYDNASLFQARRRVYQAGFFDPILHALRSHLPGGVALDAGCGEGFLLAALAPSGIGLDIAQPAVRMAAASFKGAHWCVADLCDIPLADASVDCILNVLTPANYRAFARVLRPFGRLLKVVPGERHLCEIRALTGKKPAEHHVDEAADLFARHFTLFETVPIMYEFYCDDALAADVFAMTPLTAHEPRMPVAQGEITVDVTLLVGERRQVALGQERENV